MRFWDSSALVALAIEEASSRSCRKLVRADRTIAVWIFSRTEMVSAVQRKHRRAELDAPSTKVALKRIALLASRWSEVDAVDLVRDRAERLLATHDLRAADALQLAAALVLVEDRPARFPFVTADERLAEAAEAEGFDAIVPKA